MKVQGVSVFEFLQINAVVIFMRLIVLNIVGYHCGFNEYHVSYNCLNYSVNQHLLALIWNLYL